MVGLQSEREIDTAFLILAPNFADRSGVAERRDIPVSPLSGDPYLAFAKQAGAVPADATKKSHTNERKLFKQCALAVQYGIGDVSLARLHYGGSSVSRKPRLFVWSNRIKRGQLVRKLGSGQPSDFIWDVATVRQFLLNGPPKASGRLWTIQGIQTTLAAYGLDISCDSIRRRLSRGGLNPCLTKTTSNRLNRYSNSLDQRTTSFVVDRAKIKLCPLATNQRCDQAICDCPNFCLNVLFALDRRKKLLFRCYSHEITHDDLIAFFAELIAEHAGRHVVVETGLELRGLGDFLKQHREELSAYRTPIRS